jgi:hypothetical protein
LSLDRSAIETPLENWVISDKKSLKAWTHRLMILVDSVRWLMCTRIFIDGMIYSDMARGNQVHESLDFFARPNRKRCSPCHGSQSGRYITTKVISADLIGV